MRLHRTLLRAATACVVATAGGAAAQAPAPYVNLPAGPLASVLANDADRSPLAIAAFALRRQPVTQAEFLAFVGTHPEWRRDRIPRTFSDTGYLQDWPGPEAVSAGNERRPVTHVSWFAAQAFCEAESARLPTWYEWEYAAAADPTRTDARQDPAWRATILGWYARPATGPVPEVGGTPNVYGVRDLHGLVWEWVDDFNALLVSPDSRSSNDPDKLKFCGAGAISLQQRENYAVLMRIALLSSLSASDSTGSLGFRCARSLP